MMGRSHFALGTAGYLLAVGAGILPLTTATFGLAALGSLAPDIDHGESTLGRRIPFISIPLNLLVGHRTVTHSTVAIVAVSLPTVALNLLNLPQATLAVAFFLGYVSHILADLLTIEGCALAYPQLERYSIWPRIRTGGIAEPFVVLGLCAIAGYSLFLWQPWPLTGLLHAPLQSMQQLQELLPRMPRLPW